MPEFVHQIPVRDLALLCALGAVGATWVGILFLKPFLRLLVGGHADVNQVIGYATSVFSLFYGLLIGLLAVAAYQNAERIEQAAFLEAARVGTLYGALHNYPEPLRGALREMVRDYVLHAIYEDWPRHRAGAVSQGGAHRTAAIQKRLAGFEPATVAQEIVHRETMRTFQEFLDARQRRLAGVLTRIPGVLWYAVAAGAVINILLLIMLKIRPLPHLVLGGITSFFLGVMLFVIIALDDPMRGAFGLQPDALEIVWRDQMRFDEPVF